MSLPAGYPDLVLGRRFVIPHFDGSDLNIEVPAGSNSGETIVIPRRGLPHHRSGIRGDVVVLLKLHIPSKISKSDRKIIKEIRDGLTLKDSSIESALIDDANDRRSNQ